MDDKIYHVVAYFILVSLWITYYKPLNNQRIISIVVLASVSLGALLEVLQFLLNPNRTFDVLDMLANALGVLLGTLIAVRYSLLKLK
nr:VanZ family protein [Winogradskyella alexanderae]